MPVGSFASLAIPALAYASAMVGECQKVPPASIIVDAAVNVWNQTHSGAPIPYYVPALIVQVGSESPAPGLLLLGAGSSVSGTTPSAQAGLPGNIYYAFSPANVAQNEAGSDLSQPPTPSRSYWLPFGTSPFGVDSLSPPTGFDAIGPRIVMLNSGALITSLAPASAPSTAKHVAVAGGGAVLGGLLYAYFSGKAIDTVFESAYGIAKMWLGQAVGEVEGSLAAAESLRRRKR
jgi:hypothetical protein